MEFKSPLMLQPCEAQFYPEGKLELSRAVLKPLLFNISMTASNVGITILRNFPISILWWKKIDVKFYFTYRILFAIIS